MKVITWTFFGPFPFEKEIISRNIWTSTIPVTSNNKLKYLLPTCITMMMFIIYLNMKYFPDRVQMLRELNDEIAPTARYDMAVDYETVGTDDGEKNETVIEKDILILEEEKGVTVEEDNDKEEPKEQPNETTTPEDNANKTTLKTQKRTGKKRNCVCAKFIGGLGNYMFLYASAFGVARKKNMDFIMLKTNSLLKTFQLGADNMRVVANYSLCRGAPTYVETRNCAFDKRIFLMSNKSSFWLYGYFQSYKNFEGSFAELRTQFTFKNAIQKKADTILSDIKQKYLKLTNNTKQTNVTVVGIHIRRGDFVGNNYGYTVATKEYFEKAMRWFNSKYANIAFVVCSNEISWGKKNLRKHNVYFVEKRTREVDMAVLATCDHLISSVGSFSWWASWLSKGTVIYYFPPAKTGSELRNHYSKNYTDYFLSKWIHF